MAAAMPAIGGAASSAALPRRSACRSVANGDAGDVGALQRPADRFGLIAVEAGEAGPEQLPVALGDDRFGERIGLRKQAAGLIARRIDALQRFAFALQRADLDDPSGVDGDRLDGAVLLERPAAGDGEPDRRRPSPARRRRGAGSMPAGRRARRCRCRGWPAAAAFRPWRLQAWRIRLWPASTLLVSALATTALDVSGTSGRAGGIALVIGRGRLGRTGRGQLDLSGLDLDGLHLDGLHRFRRAGNRGDGLRSGSPRWSAGRARPWPARTAAAAAKIDRDTGAGERAGAATGSGAADAT